MKYVFFFYTLEIPLRQILNKIDEDYITFFIHRFLFEQDLVHPNLARWRCF